MAKSDDRNPKPDAPTLHVRPGVARGHDGLAGGKATPVRGNEAESADPAGHRRTLGADAYVDGVLSGDRTLLARAITLIESNAAAHQDLAQQVLTALLPHRRESLRVGITGVPGAGKSTLIETLGRFLTARGHKVAVTAVDPSSSVTGGSILGDKTRMEKLAADPAAFIRPAPTGGALGGVARKTRETILLFEAAGYDVVIVETVGVGQSEVQVRSMVDVFLLVLLAGAGDELQGIKKGVVELADAILVNKADGRNVQAAERAKAGFNRALHYLRPATSGWQTRAFTCSARSGDSIAEAWRVVESFVSVTQANGVFASRRAAQERDWMRALVREGLERQFHAHAGVAGALAELEQAVERGDLPATTAARRLLSLFDRS